MTGATGYVGGRLVPRLLEAGYQVRCLVRDSSRLAGRSWLGQVEVVEADVLDPDNLPAAFEGISAAYYLIHGIQGGKVFADRDETAAKNFAQAAEAAGIDRIIYLGELAVKDSDLSDYLHSRFLTGEILRNGSVPVTEFRAGMIVGGGSVLFEMIRYLSERQLLWICPRWFYIHTQPISIHDTLSYLVSALKTAESINQIIEIGGATQLTYAQMLREYAQIREFTRVMIPVPVNAPRLSAIWVHLVSPIHWRLVLPLIEGLSVESLVTNAKARHLFPEIDPMDFRSAVELSLKNFYQGNVETQWSDSLVSTAFEIEPYRFSIEEGMFIERRQRKISLRPEAAFRAFTGIGGERGWLYMDWAWEIRGWMDEIVGGVGLNRGRRHPDDLRVGESLDFWRVEEIIPNRKLLLRAEMKTPGRAWLEFQSIPLKDSQGTLLSLGAYFAPKGVAGYLYWYLMFPVHKFIFDGMIDKLVERARLLSEQESTGNHG